MTSLHDPERGEAGDRGRSDRHSNALAIPLLIVLMLGAGLMVHSCVSDANARERHAHPPRGWTKACERGLLPEFQCTTPERAVQRISASQAWEDANRVHWAVSRALQPLSGDPDGEDVWGNGMDCEDFALQAREAMIVLGYAPGALPLVFGKTRRGEWHAWLEIHTTSGVYVIDSLEKKVARKARYTAERRCTGPSVLACVRMAR